ncbi:MAG TPA: alpha/beta hydrolase [Candidatus Dormibacteraeota bacterium]
MEIFAFHDSSLPAEMLPALVWPGLQDHRARTDGFAQTRASPAKLAFMNAGLRDIEVDGLRIAYWMEGEGPPVVFLHGFFGDHRVWRSQFELADRYRVVAWDAPGCGSSSVPPSSWSLAEYAECLAGFIDALGLESPHVVGNSFGGSLALKVYDHSPAKLRSLVLADTYAGWSGSFPPEIVEQRLNWSLPDLDLPVDQVVTKWLPGFVTQAAAEPIVTEMASIISDFNREGMRVMIQALAEADLRDVLPRVAVPVLLVWGGQDVRSPLEVAKAMRSQISTSRLVVLRGAGHLSHVEAPARFNEELRRFFARAGL